jgi:hypothetical protein
MADIIAAIQSTIAAISGLIADSTGIIADVQSAIGVAQGILAQQRYVMAAAIAAAEFKGLSHIIEGAGQLFIGTVKSIDKLVPHGFDSIFTTFVFSMSWMMCLFKNITNIQVCFFYYLLEIIGQILYLPVRIILWLLFKFRLDMYPLETKIWELVEYADRVVMKTAGFHITHYPKNIRDTCYNCKRLKMSTLVKHTTPLADDIKVAIPSYIMPGFKKIAKGAEELTHPFD